MNRTADYQKYDAATAEAESRRAALKAAVAAQNAQATVVATAREATEAAVAEQNRIASELAVRQSNISSLITQAQEMVNINGGPLAYRAAANLLEGCVKELTDIGASMV